MLKAEPTFSTLLTFFGQLSRQGYYLFEFTFVFPLRITRSDKPAFLGDLDKESISEAREVEMASVR